jgi:Tfp pilus assembly protein PilO
MKGRTPLIVAGAGVLLAILIVLILVLPKASQVKAKNNEIAMAKQQAKNLTLQLQTLRADQQEAGANRQKVATLAAKVPPTVDLPGLIRLLDTAATTAGVDFMSMAPAVPSASSDGGASIVPVSIMVDGGFFSIEQYLIQLEGLSRAMKVLSINVGQGTMPGQLTVSIMANFFTTDLSAGPGSAPGTGPGQGPSPTPSPSPTATPTPTPTGSQSPSPGG